ncbi:amino acid ABC transporter permease [Taklimakanibacter deserti]|uniref:amino acid ABC transporter permease n=1 Tax=Taklimakanibacter deserti TaxID=2267839 RepID=UPI000E64F2D3
MGYQLDFGALVQYLGLFLEGTTVTLGLTALASVAGIALGIVGAAAARSKNDWVRRLIAGYVELIRNTPFIVQMFFIFFGLPSLGLRLSALTAAALAMIINLTAYAIEIIRAGLDAVPPGQAEAGRAMGLHGLGVFGLIVLPQALATVYPALVAQITITMLESAVVSQIAVVDLTHVADLIQSRNFRSFETYLVVTVIYLILALLLRRLLALAGRSLFAGRTQ